MVHQLKREIASIRQRGTIVVVYFTRLKAMWDELSSYMRVPCYTCEGCTCGMIGELVREQDEEKLHRFLMGLDDSIFGIIRS